MQHSKTLLHERYDLRTILGRGGQATVYRAFDRTLNVERAIKLLSKELMRNNDARGRFEAEAQVMAQLRHPSIVRLYDIVSTEELLFLVMDIVAGGNVWEWVRSYGAMPEKMACLVMLDIVDAVGSLHQAGVIHRDIKPSNLLVDTQGKLLITDFGIARFERAEEEQTQTGMVMGTYGYMAPEQLASARLVTPQSDIYALGASIFALCSATVPKDLFMVKHKPALIENLSSPLQALIMNACDYDKENRFPSTDALREAIERTIPQLSDIPADTVSLKQQALLRSKYPEKSIQEEELLSITWKKQVAPTFVFDTSIDDENRTETSWEANVETVPIQETLMESESKTRGFYTQILVAVSMLLIVGFFWIKQSEQSIPQLSEACVQLSDLLTSQQKESGGFSGIVQAGASLWDSGQQLHALQWSQACGVQAEESIQKAVQYLVNGSESRHSIDIAWASLGLFDMKKKEKYLTRLASYRLSNGMYVFEQGDDVGDWYTTLLSLWAYSESERLTSKQKRKTLQSIQSELEKNWWPGLDEQLMWLRLYYGDRHPELEPSDEELDALLDRMAKRCQFKDGECTIIRWPDAQLENSKQRFTLSFHGRPWAIALFSLLHYEGIRAQDPRVQVILHWLLRREYQSRAELMGNEHYRISEHVFALGFYEHLRKAKR